MDLDRLYEDVDGNKCNILRMVEREKGWAANCIQEGEKARYALILANEDRTRDHRAAGRLANALSEIYAIAGELPDVAEIFRSVEKDVDEYNGHENW